MEEQKIENGNNLIAEFMNLDEFQDYRKSGMKDINGVEILEGSIINADGYNSNLEEKYFHCVEYQEGVFWSDIYSDYDPIGSYKKIEVIGHCRDYVHLLDTESDWEGNLGAAIKENQRGGYEYHSSWDALMPVVEKIGKTIIPKEWIKSAWDESVYYHIGKVGTSFEIGDHHVHITDSGVEAKEWVNISKSLIDRTWLAVIEFIKWYNEHKK